jgi:hypothetical protein
LLGLFLSLAGCGNADEAGGSAADGGKEDDGPNPTPVTVAQGIAAIDLRQFPVMDGAKYVERTPSHVSFVVENGVVRDAADFVRTKLAALGWKPAADPKLTQVVGEGAQMFFHKDGQRLYAAMGVSPADKNLNFTLFHLGNIDARKLPHFPGVSYDDSLPARTISNAGQTKPEEVQKALRKPFVEAGWREYREPEVKGMPRFEREDRSLKFLQNGVAVDVMIMPFQGSTKVYTTVRLQDVQWPIDPSATYIEFQPDPLFLFYPTKSEFAAVSDYTRRELAALGWKPVEGKGKTEDDKVIVKLEKAEEDPLRLEVIRNDLTFVMLRPWSSDDDRKDAEKAEEAEKK